MKPLKILALLSSLLSFTPSIYAQSEENFGDCADSWDLCIISNSIAADGTWFEISTIATHGVYLENFSILDQPNSALLVRAGSKDLVITDKKNTKNGGFVIGQIKGSPDSNKAFAREFQWASDITTKYQAKNGLHKTCYDGVLGPTLAVFKIIKHQLTISNGRSEAHLESEEIIDQILDIPGLCILAK